jgi:hypothetical protein
MTMLPRWVSRAAAHPPPGPFQASVWRSPLRGPWFTTMLSVALLPGITLMFLTGLSPSASATSSEAASFDLEPPRHRGRPQRAGLIDPAARCVSV